MIIWLLSATGGAVLCLLGGNTLGVKTPGLVDVGATYMYMYMH